MSEIFEKEGTAAGKKHVCIMEMIQIADRDADFFCNQLIDSCDDEDDLAKTVEMLISLYLQRKLKALYWVFAIMRGQGMTIPLYILTGSAFSNTEVTLFYFGAFFQRIAWRMLQTMEELIEESEQAIEEIDQQCQDQINRDMAYALQYLEVYDVGVDMKRLSAAMNDVVFLYGLTDMLERGLALVRKFVPDKGEIYSMIIRSYFFSSSDVTDEDVMEMLLGMISRRQYYREKKEAIRMMGYYFFEMVIPQMQKGRYQPAVMVGN